LDERQLQTAARAGDAPESAIQRIAPAAKLVRVGLADRAAQFIAGARAERRAAACDFVPRQVVAPAAMRRERRNCFILLFTYRFGLAPLPVKAKDAGAHS
jgi:hypothetical protein